MRSIGLRTVRRGLFGVCVAAITAASAGAEPASSVDLFIGTNPNPFTKAGYSFDTGNVFPGPVCPRGMVAWSPDTTHHKQIAGGYWYPDDTIEDFSLTHFSGRGVPCLKDIGFMPVLAVDHAPGTEWGKFAAKFSHANESAAVGYYRVKFDNGIETELTDTLRTGMARFTFPKQPTSTLLIRADGEIAIHGNEVAGNDAWKDGKPKVYFFAQFNHPVRSAQTWNGEKVSDAATAAGKSCGAVLTFDTSTDPVVPVRVGISYTSLENAKQNLQKENTGWDFDAVRQGAVALWNKELGRVEVSGGTADQAKVFYTALYHCDIHPNYLDDVNGQYRGMDGAVHTVPAGHHQYQNIPAWDEHRSHVQMMAILAPDQSSDVMQSLVNYAQQDAAARPDNGGGLPRWEQVYTNSGGMVGDGDDTIIASAYAFGATAFDTKGALAAMEKGASRAGTTSDGHKVRDGLTDYLSKGYVPGNAAVTLEYCSDDFALSQYAAALGEKQKAAQYLKQAQNWKNLFDGSTGYLRPKTADGAWLTPFSPSSEKGYVEGTAAQYLWLVNFNVAGLIERLGGNEKTVQRLDKYFIKTNDGLKTEYAYMGNEPCEECPWLYDFAGAPSRTQAVVRRVQTELFTIQPSGLPGNDDAGSLSSWYVFSALGMYPEIPGVSGFTLGSPMFPSAVIHLAGGKTITITAPAAAAGTPYVKALTVNGHPWDSPWLPWSDVSKGGTLDYDLTDQPTQWASDPTKAPPSFDAEPGR